MSRLIINADDYGLTQSCTLAIIEAFDRKLIHRTTMCANGSYFDEACLLAEKLGLKDKIGIHINLIQGKPLTQEMAQEHLFCDEHGIFRGKIDRYKFLNKAQKAILYNEVSAQVIKLREAGIPVAFADSHHHSHTRPVLLPTILRALKKQSINAIRIHYNMGVKNLLKSGYKYLFNLYLKLNGFQVTDYFGGFDDSNEIETPKANKVYEIMVHPDYNDRGVLIDRHYYVNHVPNGDGLEKMAADMMRKFTKTR